MHILIVTHNYPTPIHPAFGFFCKNQADALSKAGVRTGVVAPLLISMKVLWRSKTFLLGRKKFLEKNVFTYLNILPSIPKLKKLRYKIINRLGREMVDEYIRERGRPDVIHLHVFVAAEIAIYAKRKYNIPIVWTEHFSDVARDLLNSFEKKLLSKINEQVSFRIGVSEHFSNQLSKQMKSPFHYVPNLYDSDIFKYEGAIKPAQDFVFLNVAYLTPIKNHKRLLEAFNIYFKDKPNVYIKIVGTGESTDEIKNYAKHLGLGARILMPGEQRPEVVRQTMHEASAYVLSSDFETFNVSLIEAMACGLPLISTRCGGPESIIVEEFLGHLTDLTPHSLGEAMLAVYQGIGTYNRKKIAAYAENNFSFFAVSEKLIDIYRKCLS